MQLSRGLRVMCLNLTLVSLIPIQGHAQGTSNNGAGTNSAAIKITFDPNQSIIVVQDTGQSFPIISGKGQAHVQLNQNILTIEAFTIHFEVNFCLDPNCSSREKEHFVVQFDPFSGPVTMDASGTRFMFNGLNGTITENGEETTSLIDATGSITYAGPPPQNSLPTSFEIDFNFFAPEFPGQQIFAGLAGSVIKIN